MRRKVFPYGENSPSNFLIFQDGLPCRWASIMVGRRVQGFSISRFLMSTSSHVGATWVPWVPFIGFIRLGSVPFVGFVHIEVRLTEVCFLWIRLLMKMCSSIMSCRQPNKTIYYIARWTCQAKQLDIWFVHLCFVSSAFYV